MILASGEATLYSVSRWTRLLLGLGEGEQRLFGQLYRHKAAESPLDRLTWFTLRAENEALCNVQTQT